MSGAKASTASAVSGPTPGIVCKRRAALFFSATIFAVFVRASMRTVFSAICAIRSRHSSQRIAGRLVEEPLYALKMANALRHHVTELVKQGS